MPRTPANPPALDANDKVKFQQESIIYGPVRPHPDLHRRVQRALKSYSQGNEYFTEIMLRDLQKPGLLGIDFSVTASSPAGAERAGIFYLGQLCDLLSVITRQPLKFLISGEDSQAERIRIQRTSTNVDRILAPTEWDWIIGSIVYLRSEAPRYLAAASWYRKGLCGIDPVEKYCCFWRVVERLAATYADQSILNQDDKGKARFYIRQFAIDFSLTTIADGLLSDQKKLAKFINIRNDISHGNVPITAEMIDSTAAMLGHAEEIAFQALKVVRRAKLCLNREL